MIRRFFKSWAVSYGGIPRSIWLLAFVNLVNRMGSMVISFITIYFTQQLHFGIREAGYIMGCFGFGALAGAYLGGRLTDRFGYYPVQFWSLVGSGLMLFVVMLLRDFWSMCAAIFMMALIGEIFRPANSVAVLRNSAAETRTRSVSLIRMAYNIGWTIAPVLGGILASIGWNWLFVVDGLSCIFAALMLYWVLPPTRESVEAPAREPDPNTGIAISPLRDGPFLYFVLLTLFGAVAFMQLLWTVPVFFKEVYRWSEFQIGVFMALNGLLVFLVEMPLVYKIENRRPLLDFLRFGFLLYIAAYLAFTVGLPAFWAAFVYMVFISFGEIFVMPFSSNYMYKRAGDTNQGQYAAIYGMSYSVANILAPLFGTQWIASFGYNALWYFSAAVSLLALLGVRFLPKTSGH
jgi:predicted MFS family arabinose efflux permease